MPTDPRVRDTDGDGLTDGEEDRNDNGILDDTETDPRLPIQMEAVNRMPTNEPQGEIQEMIRMMMRTKTAWDMRRSYVKGPTPKRSDTDGDGLLDGQEDADGNGAINPGETDPTNHDTDGDGVSDELKMPTRMRIR